MNFRPSYTITSGMTADLALIERARGFLEAAKLSDDWVSRMQQRALVLEAHHTTHIEGSRLTLEQSDALLAGRAVPEADPDDTRELLNYRDAFEMVAGYLESREAITEGLIREIHKHLVRGVRGGEAAPGEWRAIQNYVVNSATGKVVYTPPPAADVAPLMRELVTWLGEVHELSAILVAGIAHFQLVHIHPFKDGNGRTARLLSTLCLYRAGYDFRRLFSISEFYDRDRPAYYRAIQSVRENGMDLTDWLAYFTRGLATQMNEVRNRGERVIRADILSRTHRLNSRQVTMLEEVLEHGATDVGRLERLFTDVDRRTLQRDLRDLVDKDLLITRGQTSRLQYVAGKGLA